MFKYGAMEKVDAVSYHPYSVSSQLLPGRIAKMRSVMDKYNFKGPVWITEMGYPTRGIYFHKKFDEKSFPQEVIKTLTYFAASGIEKVFWYTLFDNFNPEEDRTTHFNSENYFGLAYPNGQLKKGGQAFSQFRKLVGEKRYDSSFVELSFAKDGNLRAFVFGDKSSQKVLVIWRNGIISKKISLKGAIFNFKSHNIVSGEMDKISPDMIKVGKDPQIFTFETLKSSRLRIE
jgi:hypothetical protein